jgi:hypothetical protein
MFESPWRVARVGSDKPWTYTAPRTRGAIAKVLKAAAATGKRLHIETDIIEKMVDSYMPTLMPRRHSKAMLSLVGDT